MSAWLASMSRVELIARVLGFAALAAVLFVGAYVLEWTAATFFLAILAHLVGFAEGYYRGRHER